MNIRNSREKVLGGGVALLTVLGVVSGASACIPGATPDTTSFTVSPGSGKSGDLMVAAGNDLVRGNWPYMIKLRSGAYPNSGNSDADYEQRSMCGKVGVFQIEAKTADDPSHPPTHPPYGANYDRTPHDFTQPFVLNAAGMKPGAAYFCAIPGAEPTTSEALGGLTAYFDPTFNVVTLV